MLRLYIMRHAKSSWANPGQRDFDRGLNDRGKSDLPRLVRHIREENIDPELVMCSTAARTKATLDGIKEAIHPKKLRMMEELYHGTADSYFAHVKKSDAEGDIMIIGHNPSCELLAHMLFLRGVALDVEAMAWKYPTGSIACLRFDIDKWADLEPKTGYLEAFVQPRVLRFKHKYHPNG